MNATVYAGITLTALVLTVGQADADVCGYKPPKVRRVCGMIVDSSGRPIPAVNVAVLKDGIALKNEKSDENGEFDFDVKQSGKYELDAAVPGFQHARYHLTLSKPTDSCRHALRIGMAVASIHCGGDIRETKNPLRRKR
jgi:hypothetical protein